MDHYFTLKNGLLGPDPQEFRRKNLINGYSEIYELPFDITRMIDEKLPKKHNPDLIDYAFRSFLGTLKETVFEDNYLKKLDTTNIMYPPSGITELMEDESNGPYIMNRDVWSIDSTFRCIICDRDEYDCVCFGEWVEEHYAQNFAPIYEAASNRQIGIANKIYEGRYSSWKEWEYENGGYDVDDDSDII